MRLLTLFLILFMISSCGNREKKTEQEEETIKQEYLQKGGEIANFTQSELLMNVANAIKKGGPEYAIDFCNCSINNSR